MQNTTTDENRWVNWIIDHTKSNRIRWQQDHAGWVADYNGYHISVRQWDRGLFMDTVLHVIGTTGVQCHASGEVVRPLWFVVQHCGPRCSGVGGWVRRMLAGHS